MRVQFSVAFAARSGEARFASAAWRTIFLALVAFSQPAIGQDDVKSAIAWFDTLGYPDLSKAQLVKVATGQFRSYDGQPAKKEFRSAFLLATEGDSFKIMTLGLNTEWYTSTRSSSDLSSVGYEVVDLKKSVGDYLDSLTKERSSDEPSRFLGEPLVNGVERFVLARICQQRGLTEEAKTLFRQAKKGWSNERVEKAESLRQDLIDHLAQTQLLAAVNAFANPKITRPELLAKFEKIIKAYPAPNKQLQQQDEEQWDWFYGSHQATANSYVRILKRMIAEDDDHARRPRKPEKEMTTKERVAELIFRLRDQTDDDDTDDGSIPNSGPARELFKLGFDAVPQLIATLDDERFTRGVSSSALNLSWDVRVVRFGDYARQIIEQLSGRQFIGKEGRKEIDSWWKEIEAKGEKQALIDNVQAATPRAYQSALKLREKYPDAALDALAKSVENTKDDEFKRYLVDVLAGIKGDGPVPILRKQLKSPALRVRLAAAEGLSRRGIDDGVRPMIDEWRRLATSAREDNNDVDDLVKFLINSGRPEAIKALRVDLLSRNRLLQFHIIDRAGYLGRDDKDPLPFAVANARDELLVQALANTDRSGVLGSWGGQRQVDDPRYCDLAAYYLSVLWKMRQPFDFHSSQLTRERYRTDLINTWRQRQGLPPLPDPPLHRVQRLPDAVVRPNIDALVAATNDQERQKAVAAIEKLGLPALPAAREFLATTKPDHPAHTELRKMVLRLACVVREIEFSRFSARPEKETQETLESFKGKPLDISGLARLALKITDPLPKGVEGFAMEVDREGDDSGVVLKVTLFKGDRQRGTFNTGESVRVEGRFVMGQGSSFSRGHAIWQDFETALQKAFDLGPEKNVFGGARIKLIRD